MNSLGYTRFDTSGKQAALVYNLVSTAIKAYLASLTKEPVSIEERIVSKLKLGSLPFFIPVIALCNSVRVTSSLLESNRRKHFYTFLCLITFQRYIVKHDMIKILHYSLEGLTERLIVI